MIISVCSAQIYFMFFDMKTGSEILLTFFLVCVCVGGPFVINCNESFISYFLLSLSLSLSLCIHRWFSKHITVKF